MEIDETGKLYPYLFYKLQLSNSKIISSDPNETVEDTQEENSVFDDEADTRSPNQVETG